MSDSLKTEKASVKEVPLKFHDITKDEIPEVVKLVEDAYYAGDIHFIDYEKKSEENFESKIGPKIYTRTSEKELLDMIANSNDIFFGARIDTSQVDGQASNQDIVGCAFIEKCSIDYAGLDGTKNPCKLGYVCTHLKYQNLGIGKKIMKKTLSIARERMFDEVIISVVDHKDWLKKWYSSHFGFMQLNDETEEWPVAVSCFVREEFKDSTKFALMRMKIKSV